MALFESLLGAVAGPLIGGIFGGGKQKPQTTEVNYKKMVENARAAGFNPLTALRNGGSAGFTTTTPALSSRNFVGEALQAGFNQFFGYKQDQLDQERERLQTEIMRQDLANAKAQGDIFKNYGFTPPSVTTYTGGHENTVQPSLGARRSNSPTAGRDSDVTDTVIAGKDIKANPSISNADKLEERYGDLVSSVAGVGTLAADTWHNSKSTLKDKFGVTMSEPPLTNMRRSQRPKSRSNSQRKWRSSTLTTAQ